MQKIYYVKYNDDLVGTIEYPSLKFEKNLYFKGPLPLLLFPWKSDISYNPTRKNIEDFLSDRVIEKHNQGLGMVLEDMGLAWYSIMPIIDITYGTVHEDFYWLLTDETKDLKFLENHPRGIIAEKRRKFLEEGK
ncbi:MAG: hypothetical protein ACRC5M_02500 [Anaeroplasmataceae bacterium]